MSPQDTAREGFLASILTVRARLSDVKARPFSARQLRELVGLGKVAVDAVRDAIVAVKAFHDAYDRAVAGTCDVWRSETNVIHFARSPRAEPGAPQ